MAQNHEFFWDKRPQSLCKKCGMCCRIATTPKSHEELLQLAAAGDQGAIDFLEIFEPYASIEDAMLVDRAQVERIGYDENTTFYKCRFIQKNNLCPCRKRCGFKTHKSSIFGHPSNIRRRIFGNAEINVN